MTNDDENQWLRGEEAAARLGISERSIQRYAGEGRGKIRTRKYQGSNRYWYYRPDVEVLAEELGVARRPPSVPKQPKQELIPAGEMLGYLRQRDEQLAEAQQALQAAALELGQARAEIARRQIVDGQVQAVSAERDEMRRRITQLRLQRAVLITIVVILILALVGFFVIVELNLYSGGVFI
jgi:hypothetical protein